MITDASDTTSDLLCPGHHDPHVPGAPVWCRPCGDRIESALVSLHDAYDQLANATDIATRTRTERPAGRTTRDQYDGRIEHADEILRACCSWANLVAETVGDSIRWTDPTHRPRRDGRPGLYLHTAVDYLVDRHTAALSNEGYSPDYGHEIRALAKTAERLLGGSHGPEYENLEGPCGNCATAALQRRIGTDDLICRACHRPSTMREYDAYTAYLAHETTT